MLVQFITSRDDLVKFVNQEPLVETKPSLHGIHGLESADALYLGVGLCNGKPILSRGAPVDLLSMILVGERLAPEKHLLIADTHAVSNGFPQDEVDMLAEQYTETVERAVRNLGFSNWSVIRASEFDQSTEYLAQLEKIDEENDYIRREIADMLFFHKRGVDLKLGWCIKGKGTLDETAFDEKFRHQFGTDLSFVYSVAGRTFDSKHQLRAPPYFCADPETRILLHPEEDVLAKTESARERFGKADTKPYEKFLGQIVRAYDKIAEPTERKKPVLERLQQIITRCTR